MRGNSPVQFLGEGTVGTLSSYPTRQLIDEARLQPDQRILVAREPRSSRTSALSGASRRSSPHAPRPSRASR